jgi:polysaccharide export outer membrane protein
MHEPRGSAQILAGEQEILDFQRRAREGERDLLSQQIARLASEKAALTEQAGLAERQVELTREQSSEYNKLATTGHGLRTVQVERERDYARTRAEAARLRAELAKNETALGELTLRLRELDTTYMRRVVLELQETRQKILEIERSLPTAREIAESRRRRLVASEGSGAAADWDIRITRQAGLTPVTIQAKFETTLQPGDIVQVAPKARSIEGAVPGDAARTPMRSLTGPRQPAVIPAQFPPRGLACLQGYVRSSCAAVPERGSGQPRATRFPSSSPCCSASVRPSRTLSCACATSCSTRHSS